MKQENGCSNIIDLVKARLQRISNSLTEQEVNAAITDFKQWEMYRGKLAEWFQGTTVFFCYLFQIYQTY